MNVGLRFKLDENVSELLCAPLEEAGHDVHSARSESLTGAADCDVLKACVTEGRILVTLDLDFSNIQQYPPQDHRGIWVLRPRRQSISHIHLLVFAGVRLALGQSPEGQLWVIDDHRVRIRQ